jgi:hypothetical protein
MARLPNPSMACLSMSRRVISERTRLHIISPFSFYAGKKIQRGIHHGDTEDTEKKMLIADC